MALRGVCWRMDAAGRFGTAGTGGAFDAMSAKSESSSPQRGPPVTTEEAVASAYGGATVTTAGAAGASHTEPAGSGEACGKGGGAGVRPAEVTTSCGDAPTTPCQSAADHLRRDAAAFGMMSRVETGRRRAAGEEGRGATATAGRGLLSRACCGRYLLRAAAAELRCDSQTMLTLPLSLLLSLFLSLLGCSDSGDDDDDPSVPLPFPSPSPAVVVASPALVGQ